LPFAENGARGDDRFSGRHLIVFNEFAARLQGKNLFRGGAAA
jgi:hypothetical protein